MKVTLLTCSHNRPEAFALCERWIARQTVKPTQWLVLDSSSTPLTCTQGQEHHHWPDLTGMVAKVKFALQTGLTIGDVLIFVEDDDFYSPDYIEWCLNGLKRYHLVGECQNLYYNVRYRWWYDHKNKAHASLCATSMRRDVFPFLLQECQNTNDPFIDSRLWNNCRLSKMPFDPVRLGKRRTIGIKAMPGTKGYGSGHDPKNGWAIQDPNLVMLRKLIGDDADIYAKFYDPEKQLRPIAQVSEMPIIEVHIVAFNEELILPYALRHYKTFARSIIVHDGGSTDGTLAICAAAGVEVRAWDTGGKINDVLLTKLKEEAWAGTDADWVAMVDADELIHFPKGVIATLKAYESRALAVVKPHGWEMESPHLPKTDGQIYEEIDHGAPDDRWYAKPVFFSPKRVRRIKYSAGAHECAVELHGGLKMGNPVRFSEPPALLLHYKHIGSVERIGERYDGNKSRFSEENKKNGWGWGGCGFQHATDKRNAIMSKRQKVL